MTLPAYPWLRCGRDDDVRITSAGPGWNGLIRDMLAGIDQVMAGTDARLNVPLIRKNAWGKLGFEHRFDAATIDQQAAVAGICQDARIRSAVTCIACGHPGAPKYEFSWPLCDAHADGGFLRPDFPWLVGRESIDTGILGTGWITLIREMFGAIDKVLALTAARLTAYQLRMTWKRELVFQYGLDGAIMEQEHAIRTICDGVGRRATSICLYCGASNAKVRHGASCDPCCEKHADAG